MFRQVQEGVTRMITASGRGGKTVADTRESERLPEQAEREQQGQGQDAMFHFQSLARSGRVAGWPVMVGQSSVNVTSRISPVSWKSGAKGVRCRIGQPVRDCEQARQRQCAVDDCADQQHVPPEQSDDGYAAVPAGDEKFWQRRGCCDWPSGHARAQEYVGRKRSPDVRVLSSCCRSEVIEFHEVAP